MTQDAAQHPLIHTTPITREKGTLMTEIPTTNTRVIMISTGRTGRVVDPMVGQDIPPGHVRVTWDGGHNGAVIPASALDWNVED